MTVAYTTSRGVTDASRGSDVSAASHRRRLSALRRRDAPRARPLPLRELRLAAIPAATDRSASTTRFSGLTAGWCADLRCRSAIGMTTAERRQRRSRLVAYSSPWPTLGIPTVRLARRCSTAGGRDHSRRASAGTSATLGRSDVVPNLGTGERPGFRFGRDHLRLLEPVPGDHAKATTRPRGSARRAVDFGKYKTRTLGVADSPEQWHSIREPSARRLSVVPPVRRSVRSRLAAVLEKIGDALIIDTGDEYWIVYDFHLVIL